MWKQEDWEYARHLDCPGNPLMAMDPLHVRTIYDLVMSTKPRVVLEIGPHWGYSTSALVQARADGWDGKILCCDTEISDSLIRVLRSHSSSWSVAQCTSWFCLENMKAGDLVIIDGDHSLDCVQGEYDRIVEAGWETVIAHDVGRKGGCDGPQWLRETLENSPNWLTLVDEVNRPGQATHRGLLLATQSPRVLEAAQRIWPCQTPTGGA